MRSKIQGNAACPRLNVYKSNRFLFLQIIDDQNGKTLLRLHSKQMKEKNKTRTELALLMGEKIAKLAQEKNIKKIVFDRGGYPYHGIVKNVADGARQGGLKF